jgi:hypothetical protein
MLGPQFIVVGRFRTQKEPPIYVYNLTANYTARRIYYIDYLSWEL